MIIGICGKIASGKSLLAKSILAAGEVMFDSQKHELQQAEIVEVDALAHELYRDEAIKQAIKAAFGAVVFQKANISRPKLGVLVFESLSSLKQLEEIIHPPMQTALARKVQSAKQNGNDLLLVAALPKTFRFQELCDQIINVPVDRVTAFRRIQQRMPALTEHAFNTVWQRQENEYPCEKP